MINPYVITSGFNTWVAGNHLGTNANQSMSVTLSECIFENNMQDPSMAVLGVATIMLELSPGPLQGSITIQDSQISGGGGPGLALLDYSGNLRTVLHNVTFNNTAQQGNPPTTPTPQNWSWYIAPIVINAGPGDAKSASFPTGWAPWAPSYGNLSMTDVTVRHSAAPWPASTCELALASLCGHPPGGGSLQCRACAGDHADELVTDSGSGCIDADIKAFCAPGSAPPPPPLEPSPWMIVSVPGSSQLAAIAAGAGAVRVETTTPKQTCQALVLAANSTEVDLQATCVPGG